MDLLEREQAGAVRHPWETARRRFFSRLLRRAVGPVRTALDVGAGDAWVARGLVEEGLAARVTCWDRGYEPALLARQGLVATGAIELVAEAPARRFDLLLLLDVLEHVEDDAGLLAGVVERNLSPGGHALVAVPAWPALYSAHDARLRHLRRYRPSGLRALAGRAGLELLAAGGLFHGLLPVRALAALGDRLAPGSSPRDLPTGVERWRASAAISAALGAALALDTGLTELLLPLRLSLPGLSTWVLCQKPPRS